jgi:hypothetical protein
MAERKKMVVAVFRDPTNAQRAHDSLRRRGYTENEINVLMSDKTRATHFAGKEKGELGAGTMATEGTAVGGAIGAAVGAAVGAIATIGSWIAIPWTGGASLLIAGPLAAGLAGAGAGALTGGLVGALVGWGIPEQNAEAYNRALDEGGIVLGVVPHNDDDADAIKDEFTNLKGDNVCYC